MLLCAAADRAFRRGGRPTGSVPAARGLSRWGERDVSLLTYAPSLHSVPGTTYSPPAIVATGLCVAGFVNVAGCPGLSLVVSVRAGLAIEVDCAQI